MTRGEGGAGASQVGEGRGTGQCEADKTVLSKEMASQAFGGKSDFDCNVMFLFLHDLLLVCPKSNSSK